MTKNDLRIGETYSFNSDWGQSWVLKLSNIVNDTLYGSCSTITNEYYSDQNWGKFKGTTNNWRLATFDEKQHLLQCIAAGKYVEYSKKDCLQLNYLIL